MGILAIITLFGFQLGHFSAEMDSLFTGGTHSRQNACFNWATSQQKWIDERGDVYDMK